MRIHAVRELKYLVDYFVLDFYAAFFHHAVMFRDEREFLRERTLPSAQIQAGNSVLCRSSNKYNEVKVNDIEKQIEELTAKCDFLEKELKTKYFKNGFAFENVSQTARENQTHVQSDDYLAQSRHSKYRKEIKSPTFDGSFEIEEFFIQFEQVARWNGWSRRECASQLIMSLRGSARHVLSEIPLTKSDNYDVLKNICKSYFSPTESVKAYQVEFKTARRQNGETVEDFGYALKRLALKSYPHIPYEYLEPHIVDQFIFGLGDIDLQKHVQFRHPSTIEKAIGLAIEYESFVRNFVANQMPVSVHTSDSDFEFISENKLNAFIREEIQKALCEHFVDEVESLQNLNTSDCQNFSHNITSKSCHLVGHCSENSSSLETTLTLEKPSGTNAMVGSLVSGRSNITEHSRPFEVESQNQTEPGKTPDKVQYSEENARFYEVTIAHDVPVDVISSSTCNSVIDESERSDTELQADYLAPLFENYETLNPEVNVFTTNSQNCSDLSEMKENEHMANSTLKWKLDGRTVPPGKVISLLSDEIPLQLSFVGTTSKYKPVSPVLYPYCRPEHPKGIG